MLTRLIRTDFKRISRYAAYMAVAAAVIMPLLLYLAAKAEDIIYAADNRKPLSIGIVMSADSDMARIAYSTIEDMESYRSSCSFIEIEDTDTAMDMLKGGELFAVSSCPTIS